MFDLAPFDPVAHTAGIIGAWLASLHTCAAYVVGLDESDHFAAAAPPGPSQAAVHSAAVHRRIELPRLFFTALHAASAWAQVTLYQGSTVDAEQARVVLVPGDALVAPGRLAS